MKLKKNAQEGTEASPTIPGSAPINIIGTSPENAPANTGTSSHGNVPLNTAGFSLEEASQNNSPAMGKVTSATADESRKTVQNNLRVYEDTKNLFNSICKNLGLKQADGFDLAVTALEMQGKAEAIPDFKGETDKVKANLEALMRSFLSLEDSLAMSKELALAECRRELDAKDKTITALSNTHDVLSQKVKDFTAALETLTEKADNQSEELSQLHSAVSDKDLLIESLLNEKKMYSAETFETLSNENAQLHTTVQELRLNVEKLTNALKQNEQQMQLEVKAASLAAKEESQATVFELQSKITTLFDRIATLTEANSELKEQLRLAQATT